MAADGRAFFFVISSLIFGSSPPIFFELFFFSFWFGASLTFETLKKKPKKKEIASILESFKSIEILIRLTNNIRTRATHWGRDPPVKRTQWNDGNPINAKTGFPNWGHDPPIQKSVFNDEKKQFSFFKKWNYINFFLSAKLFPQLGSRPTSQEISLQRLE